MTGFFKKLFNRISGRKDEAALPSPEVEAVPQPEPAAPREPELGCDVGIDDGLEDVGDGPADEHARFRGDDGRIHGERLSSWYTTYFKPA